MRTCRLLGLAVALLLAAIVSGCDEGDHVDVNARIGNLLDTLATGLVNADADRISGLIASTVTVKVPKAGGPAERTYTHGEMMVSFAELFAYADIKAFSFSDRLIKVAGKTATVAATVTATARYRDDGSSATTTGHIQLTLVQSGDALVISRIDGYLFPSGVTQD